MSEKKALRKAYIAKRNEITPNEAAIKSALITDQLLGLKAYCRSESIMFYVSASGEVDTHDLIKGAIAANKKVYVPITHPESLTMEASRLLHFESELQFGHYQILEPAKEFIRICSPNEIDCIIIPGLAFDKQGYRLGYGAGYYDKYLAKTKPGVVKIGLAYDFQICDSLPYEDYDIPCDYIVTPTGVIMI